jgi:hypothetical protein
VPGASEAGALAHKTQITHDKLSAKSTAPAMDRRKIVIVRGALEREVQQRGFHMALIGTQYVILCDPDRQMQIIC